jgi:uncharacterized protein (DUF849 family)
MDAARFEETAALIREKCGVIINMTTSGEAGASDEKRMAHLHLKPEMASFDAGSFNWMPAGIFENSPQFLAKLAKTIKQYQVKPEMEIFDSGFMNIVDYYVKQGLLETPVHYQFALGVLGGMEATVENLVYLHNRLPKDATWSAFGIGKNHLKILYATIALGGHVRVGLEECIYYARGQLATNEQLVARAVRLVNAFQKTPATPDEAREMLNLQCHS